MPNNRRVLDALEVVIEYLDSQMETAPNRELADASNFLEGVKAELEDEE